LRTFDDPMQALSWLFDTKILANVFNHIIDIEGAGKALCKIQQASQSPHAGGAAIVAGQWQEFQACMGPPLTKELLESGTFREVCPSPTPLSSLPPMDDELTVWSHKDGTRVVARSNGKWYQFDVVQ